MLVVELFNLRSNPPPGGLGVITHGLELVRNRKTDVPINLRYQSLKARQRHLFKLSFLIASPNAADEISPAASLIYSHGFRCLEDAG
jgi:hypothetical protein